MKIVTLVSALLIAAAAMCLDGRALAQGGEEAAARVAIVTLGEPGLDVIGPHVNAALLRTAINLIPASDGPDVIVLRINSNGGMLAETPRLSDLIHDELKRKARVVVWVDKALSAAALVALTSEEIVMTPGGTLGAVVTMVKKEGQVEALSGEELGKALLVGAEVARRGNHNARLIRSMQSPDALSVDRDASGAAVFRADADGAELVNPQGSILTLNASTAEKFGVSKGTASTPDELMKVLGIGRWREVGTRADDDLRSSRRAVGEALVEITKLRQTREQGLREIRSAQSPEERRAAMTKAARADADAGKLMLQWPNLREYVSGIDFDEALRPRAPNRQQEQPFIP